MRVVIDHIVADELMFSVIASEGQFPELLAHGHSVHDVVVAAARAAGLEIDMEGGRAMVSGGPSGFGMEIAVRGISKRRLNELMGGG